LAVVQHLPDGFVKSLRAFLQAATSLEVLTADAPTRVCAGRVILPPPGCHLVAQTREFLAPSDAPPEGGRRPSADVLFRSLAVVYGRAAVGVVLSGTGDDGSRGLLAMRLRGALTIAESKDTQAASGMPLAALERGAALRALRPRDIASALQGAAAEHRVLAAELGGNGR
jgi:two-component system chemotaxis response regulator CheB